MRLLRTKTLSAHIIRNVLLFCVALFLLIFSVYYYFTHKTIKETTTENAVLLAENTAGQIEQVLTSAQKSPEIIAKMLESSFIPRDSIFHTLKSTIALNKNIYGSAVAFEPYLFPDKGYYFSPYVYKSGDSICSMMLGDESYEYFYMDWYQIPKMTNAPYWSEPYFDEGGGNILMTTYSVPFYLFKDGVRTFCGVVTIDLSLEWLTEFMSSIKILESGYAFVLSRNGVVVTHPNRSYVMNESIFSIAKQENKPALREIGREMIQGGQNLEPAKFLGFKGNEKLWINYKGLQSSRWSVGVLYPDNEMYSSLHKMNILILALIIAGLLLLTLVTIKIVRKITSPLKDFADSARVIAEGNFKVDLPKIKSEDEMKELYNSFSYMQKELANYIVNLKDTTAAKEKIESELRIAREIQMSMIPHIFPPFPDLPQIDLFAVLKSAKEVGGDLYDFFVLEGKKFCFAIGDVSGKGVPASLFMAVTRTLVRSISDNDSSPGAIVNKLNRSISENNDSSMFVTFFLGVLDLTTGELRYSNAGHNPPVIIRHNTQPEMLEKTKSIPVGLFEDFNYIESSIYLKPGDKLFLYTDGVTEAENSSNELYGEQKMISVIKSGIELSPKELIVAIEADISSHVAGFAQSDDITMMTIVYNG